MKLRRRTLLFLACLAFGLGALVSSQMMGAVEAQGNDGPPPSPTPIVYEWVWVHNGGMAPHVLVLSDGTRIRMTEGEYEGYRETGLLPMERIR